MTRIIPACRMPFALTQCAPVSLKAADPTAAVISAHLFNHIDFGSKGVRAKKRGVNHRKVKSCRLQSGCRLSLQEIEALRLCALGIGAS